MSKVYNFTATRTQRVFGTITADNFWDAFAKVAHGDIDDILDTDESSLNLDSIKIDAEPVVDLGDDY